MANEAVNHETHEHPCGAGHQRITTAALLDDIKTGKGAANIDGSENDLRHVAVTQSCGGKDRRAKVEEEVGACKLEAKGVSVQYFMRSSTLPFTYLLAGL